MGRAAEDNTSAHLLMSADHAAFTVLIHGLGQTGQTWRSIGSPGDAFEQSRYCDKTPLHQAKQETSGKLAALYGALFLPEDMEITAEGEAEERRWVTAWAGLISRVAGRLVTVVT